MPQTYTEVIFDIETQKIFDDVGSNNPLTLAFSIVSLYKRILDEICNELDVKFKVFWQGRFSQMWPFSNVIGHWF